MAASGRRTRIAAAPTARSLRIDSMPALRRASTGGAVIVDATERFRCRHQFVGYPGFLRCATCQFRVSQLPLSKPGAMVLQFRS